MSIVIKIRDAEFKRQIQRATAQGLQRAGVYLHSRCVQAVNRSNTHRHVAKFTSAQSARRGGQASGVVYENMHNQYAGQPPFKRTGAGQANIVYEYNGKESDPRVRVGVRRNAMYLIYLELGTRRVLARPWLLAMLNKYKAVLARLCLTGGKR